MGRTHCLYGGTEPYKKSSHCSGRSKKTKGQTETKMGRWCDGRCQEAGGEKFEECRKEQEQLAEASEEGLGSKWAAVLLLLMMMMMTTMMMMMMMTHSLCTAIPAVHHTRPSGQLQQCHLGALS